MGLVKNPVSTNGGDYPRWRRDGTELYYIAPDGRLMAVPVTTAPTFAPGAPVPLFAVRLPKGPTAFPYDVAHGGRFLVNSLDAPAADPSGELTVVLNWAAR